MNRKRVVLSTLWTGWGLFVLSLFVPSFIFFGDMNGWQALFLPLMLVFISPNVMVWIFVVLVVSTNACMLISPVAFFLRWTVALRLLLYVMPIAAAGICILGLIEPEPYGYYLWVVSFVLVSVGLFLDRKNSVNHS